MIVTRQKKTLHDQVKLHLYSYEKQYVKTLFCEPYFEFFFVFIVLCKRNSINVCCTTKFKFLLKILLIKLMWFLGRVKLKVVVNYVQKINVFYVPLSIRFLPKNAFSSLDAILTNLIPWKLQNCSDSK